MITLGEDLNSWGEPVTNKAILTSKVEAPVEEEGFSLDDLDLTLRFLSEQTEPELSVEDKKETLLKEARIVRQEYKSKKEHFCHEMEALGVENPEALWADADM